MFDIFLKQFTNRSERSQAIAELRGMTDRELNDLGISRGQIPAYVDGVLKPML